MLDTELKSQLAAYLEKLQQPIELVASLDDSDAARELDALLGEIAALSSKITRKHGDAARKPSFEIRRAGTSLQCRWLATDESQVMLLPHLHDMQPWREAAVIYRPGRSEAIHLYHRLP